VRRRATPREIADWEEQLAPLQPDRRGAVVDLLAEVIGDCRICNEPIRRCDPRVLAGYGLSHLACIGRWGTA
jgi:hypothetical protein